MHNPQLTKNYVKFGFAMKDYLYILVWHRLGVVFRDISKKFILILNFSLVKNSTCVIRDFRIIVLFSLEIIFLRHIFLSNKFLFQHTKLDYRVNTFLNEKRLKNTSLKWKIVKATYDIRNSNKLSDFYIYVCCSPQAI